MAFLIDHMVLLCQAIFLCYYHNTQWTVINHILAHSSEITATAVECRFQHLWLLQLHNLLMTDVLGVPSIQMTLLAHVGLYARLFIRITTALFIVPLKPSSEYLTCVSFLSQWQNDRYHILKCSKCTQQCTNGSRKGNHSAHPGRGSWCYWMSFDCSGICLLLGTVCLTSHLPRTLESCELFCVCTTSFC